MMSISLFILITMNAQLIGLMNYFTTTNYNCVKKMLTSAPALISIEMQAMLERSCVLQQQQQQQQQH